jgi:hypothetical protein
MNIVLSLAANVSIRQIVATQFFPMYVAHSSIMNNASRASLASFLRRHINGRQSTFIIRIMHHCLIITGLCLHLQVFARVIDEKDSLKVPAIRSVLEYLKCAIHHSLTDRSRDFGDVAS